MARYRIEETVDSELCAKGLRLKITEEWFCGTRAPVCYFSSHASAEEVCSTLNAAVEEAEGSLSPDGHVLVGI